MRRFRLRLPVAMLRKETCFFLRRLSGLLSGYLPTDTRPQARAKLGKSPNKIFELGVKRFFAACTNFLIAVARSCQNSAAVLLLTAPQRRAAVTSRQLQKVQLASRCE